MESFIYANILSSLLILIPSIHSTSEIFCPINGDLRIPKKIVYENNVPSQMEMETTFSPKMRVKRQDQGGKFEEASTMGMMRIVQMLVQMIMNIFSKKDVGGSTPWAAKVPKPVVMLFKEKIGTVLVKKQSKEEEEQERKEGG